MLRQAHCYKQVALSALYLYTTMETRVRPFGAKCSFNKLIQPGNALICDVFDMQADKYIGKALCSESY